MAMYDLVFLTPSDILSFEKFENDPLKLLSSRYEEMKKTSFKHMDLKNNLKSLLKENSSLITENEKLVVLIESMRFEKNIFEKEYFSNRKQVLENKILSLENTLTIMRI